MPMKLITKAVEQEALKFPIGSQSENEDPTTWLKLFHPSSRYTFYVTEADFSTGELYGYCISPLGPDCDEWGPADLEEIQSLRGAFGLKVERDMHFTPGPVSDHVQRRHGITL